MLAALQPLPLCATVASRKKKPHTHTHTHRLEVENKSECANSTRLAQTLDWNDVVWMHSLWNSIPKHIAERETHTHIFVFIRLYINIEMALCGFCLVAALHCIVYHIHSHHTKYCISRGISFGWAHTILPLLIKFEWTFLLD